MSIFGRRKIQVLCLWMHIDIILSLEKQFVLNMTGISIPVKFLLFFLSSICINQSKFFQKAGQGSPKKLFEINLKGIIHIIFFIASIISKHFHRQIYLMLLIVSETHFKSRVFFFFTQKLTRLQSGPPLILFIFLNL